MLSASEQKRLDLSTTSGKKKHTGLIASSLGKATWPGKCNPRTPCLLWGTQSFLLKLHGLKCVGAGS